MLSPFSSPAAAIRAVFFVQALCIGASLSRLAELQQAMGATPAEFGLALLGFDVGAFIAFPFASRAVERYGTRALLLAGIPFFALAIALVYAVPNAVAFFCLSIFAAMGFTFTATAMNVEADRVEYALGRRLMNSCHGLWSLGFFVSSLAGTGLVAAGIEPFTHLLGVFVVASLCALLFVRPLKPSPPRPFSGEKMPPRFAFPTVATLMIIGFALGSIWLEAAARSWSVIYLRDTFATPAWVATLTLPVCIGAQVVGRLFADGWIERFGPVRVAATLSAVSLAGVLLVVFGPNIAVALFGFVLIGVGVATAFPQAMSAAARLGDRPASQNVASIQLMNTVALFLAPPVMGFTASHWGMRASFALILPLLVLAIAMSRVLRERDAPAPVNSGRAAV